MCLLLELESPSRPQLFWLMAPVHRRLFVYMEPLTWRSISLSPLQGKEVATDVRLLPQGTVIFEDISIEQFEGTVVKVIPKVPTKNQASQVPSNQTTWNLPASRLTSWCCWCRRTTLCPAESPPGSASPTKSFRLGRRTPSPRWPCWRAITSSSTSPPTAGTSWRGRPTSTSCPTPLTSPRRPGKWWGPKKPPGVLTQLQGFPVFISACISSVI